MATIILTGISGFLGSHLARELCSGHSVVGFSRASSDLSRVSDLAGKIHLRSFSRLIQTFAEFKPEIIINCAVAYGFDNEPASAVVETNVGLPLHLAELGVQFGAKKFIHLDSFFSKFYGSYEHLRAYQRSKVQALEWLADYCPKLSVLNARMEHIYGVGDRPGKAIPALIQRICSNEISISLTSGSQRRDFLYVTDAARALRALAESDDVFTDKIETIDVGSGVATELRRFLEIAKGTSNSSSTLDFGSLAAREGEPQESKADISTLRSLGWEPKVSLEEGIGMMVGEVRRKGEQ